MTSVAFLQQNATSDTAAIASLLSPHEAALRFLCRELLGNHDDAEDALQETFLRAIRGLPQFRQDAQLKTWLTRIAIRVCLEQRRRRPQPESELPAPTPTLTRNTDRQSAMAPECTQRALSTPQSDLSPIEPILSLFGHRSLAP